MNTSLSTFLKIGVTVVVIAALLFSVGYKMIETETTTYQTDKISSTNHPLSTTSSSSR
jgi:high-affinity Fe2+/Pb2+ permease